MVLSTSQDCLRVKVIVRGLVAMGMSVPKSPHKDRSTKECVGKCQITSQLVLN